MDGSRDPVLRLFAVLALVSVVAYVVFSEPVRACAAEVSALLGRLAEAAL